MAGFVRPVYHTFGGDFLRALPVNFNPVMVRIQWFAHFSRSIEPLLEGDIRLLWHCDGNLMDMVP
jgi:hypothetical protein